VAHIVDDDSPRVRSGWSCPGCGVCWSPSVLACHHCPDGVQPDPPADTSPELVVRTTRGPVPLSRVWEFLGESGTAPAIFVPIRDVPGATPTRMREVQEALNHAARATGDLVEGKFVTLPPGAEVVPAHPGREWIRVIPPMLAGSGCTRIMRATDEWADVVPGLQCRLRCIGEQHLEFRLTPADGSPWIRCEACGAVTGTVNGKAQAMGGTA
jgi:hypothetical protein